MFVLILGCITPSLAAADDITKSTQNYVGIQALGLLESYDDSGGAIQAEDTYGIGIKYGLRFDGPSEKMDLGLELNLNWYSTMDINVLGLETEFDTVSFMARYKMYATSLGNGAIEPYFYAGLGVQVVVWDVAGTTITEADSAYELGLGAEWDVAEHVSLFAEGGYVLSTGQLDGLDFVGVAAGINFKF